MKLDLHIHSNKSDGTESRLDLLKAASDFKLEIISFTDHNYFDNKNSDLTEDYLKKYKEEPFSMVLPGTEIDISDYNSMHFLVYNVFNGEKIIEKLAELKKQNHEIALNIINNISNNFKINISQEEVSKYARSKYLEKRDIIEFLLQKKIVSSVNEASFKYTGKESICYIPRAELTAEETINLAHILGGKVFLAHPSSLQKDDDELENIIKELKTMGLDGIEVYNSSRTTLKQLRLNLFLAHKYNLLTSSGSDFHNYSKKPYKIGVRSDFNSYVLTDDSIQEELVRRRR